MTNGKGKYAWTVTVGEKGQIVIPKKAREIFGIKSGDAIILLGDEKQGLAIPPQSMFNKVVSAVFGELSQEDEGEKDDSIKG